MQATFKILRVFDPLLLKDQDTSPITKEQILNNTEWTLKKTILYARGVQGRYHG
jgi:hypothetical protein